MRQEPVVDGRFELLRLAGAGGMGRVYEALDRRSGSRVALKLLGRPEAHMAARFAREVQALAGVQHPGVVRHVAHGMTGDGEPYLVMEWLEGETLGARLSRGPLGVAESAALGMQIADALGAVHRAGVVHRDLKPSNVVLAKGALDRPVLVDFGIAHVAGAQTLTHTGAVLGTPGYMAPEQARSERDLDARADVFALGCVMFRCLTGVAPFTADHALGVMLRVLLDDPPRLRDLRQDVPHALEMLVTRMLSKTREGRPGDAESVASSLRAMGDLGAGSSVPYTMPLSAGRREITCGERRLLSLVLIRDASRSSNAEPPPSGPQSGDDGMVTFAEPALRERALRAASDRYGGHMERLPDGTVVVVLRGVAAPTDLAARAGRCALAIRVMLGGAPVAVATGRAELEARLPVGELIDRSVRLLEGSVAPEAAGAVLVDEVTARLLGPRFDLKPAASGYALRGERDDDPPPLLMGRPTPCVGRSRELALLEAAFTPCVEESSASAVLVTAPPGLGKSRLRQELVRRLRARGEPIDVWIGRGEPLSAGAAFGVLARAVRHALGVSADEPAPVSWRRIQAHAAGLPDAERAAIFLGELTGAPVPGGEENPQLRAARRDPRLMGDQIRRAAEDLLRAACATRPVVLVFEDLQWGDLPSITFVGSVLRNLRDLPLFVLALARPEVHGLFPGLWEDLPVHVIRLGELPRRAAERLARDVLGDSVSDEQLRTLVGRAGGNTFYLEELIRAVAEGRGDNAPETVLAMAQARLEALDPEARRVLRAASVFGGAFSQSGVESLLGGTPAGHRLEDLVVGEVLLRRADPDHRHGAEYDFRHALVREAAYGMLTEGDRSTGHRLAGDWLERAGHGDALALAGHFERGGEPSRAGRWYRRAAEEALQGNDLEAALDRARRGVACGAEGGELGALRLVEVEAHLWRGELTRAESRAREAAALLPPGTAGWYRAMREASLAAQKLGAVDRMEEWVTRACNAEPATDAESALLVCLASSAASLAQAGCSAAAEELLKRAQHLASHRSDVDDQARALLSESEALRAASNGDPAASLELFQAALRAFERAGDRRYACSTQSNIGYLLTELGDPVGAEAALRGALEDAEQMGLHQLVPAVQENLGYVLAQVGRLDEARVLVEKAIVALKIQGSQRLEGIAHTYLARIALLSGDPAAAEKEARVAVDMLEVAPPVRAAAFALLARALLTQSRAVEALAPAEEAAAQLIALGPLEEGEALVGLVHAEALAAAGRQGEALVALDAARSRLHARAAYIRDPARRTQFLTRVPDHAALLAAAL
ncbi:protein kinase domain-containing protein [Chondromyces crocatus]|uniref:Protein kinase n=1 Tax=Chondromyces crocatus TaxID=52 RepID=A0A0K1E9P7_CHOCO|nr:protein kinase [Chondromyces crocatus]AKT37596.1 protein kinase [Chondromyces crocatus]